MTALAVPSCPACFAPLGEIAWTGGAPPAGSDSWRCTRCGHCWTTAPARGRLTDQIAEARRLLERPEDEGLGCWSAPSRCAALEAMLANVCDLAEAVPGTGKETS